MEHNEHNNEAEALFATKRKQQQAEEAERKRLEELERQKQQMAEEVKRLEALQAARLEQEARLAQQTNEGPGTGAGPAGGKKALDPKKKKLILIGALAGLAVVALAVVLILVLGSKSKPTDEPSGSRGVETTEEADLTLFYGMWKYDEYQNRFEINDDGTWTMYDGVGDETSSGVYRWEEGRLVLEDEDGNTAAALNLGTDDRLYDQDGDALSAYDTNWDDGGEYLYFDGSYYRFFDLDLSWSEARAYCIEQGGHLVTVNSPEEQAFLTESYLNINNSNVGPWLGAYSEGAFGGDKNDWRWVTGEAWSFTNWEAGEPSNSHGTEWYAHFWKNMQWNDVADNDPRNSQHGFICEYDDLEDEAAVNGYG